METAKLIKETRLKLGLTQREFAGMLGTTRANIANYETRVIAPGDLILRVNRLLVKIDAPKKVKPK